MAHREKKTTTSNFTFKGPKGKRVENAEPTSPKLLEIIETRPKSKGNVKSDFKLLGEKVKKLLK